MLSVIFILVLLALILYLVFTTAMRKSKGRLGKFLMADTTETIIQMIFDEMNIRQAEWNPGSKTAGPNELRESLKSLEEGREKLAKRYVGKDAPNAIYQDASRRVRIMIEKDLPKIFPDESQRQKIEKLIEDYSQKGAMN